MIVLGRQSKTGVELGSKLLRTGQYWFVNGFGHGLEHAEENILMERIENLPVQEAEKALGYEYRMQFKVRFHRYDIHMTLERCWLKRVHRLSNLFPGAHQGQFPVYAESTLPPLSAVPRITLPSVFSKYSLSKQISINHTPSPIGVFSKPCL
jgi:hypothetical protein